jgi:hypothetical protein
LLKAPVGLHVGEDNKSCAVHARAWELTRHTRGLATRPSLASRDPKAKPKRRALDISRANFPPSRDKAEAQSSSVTRAG